jgi:hypothetical protein
MFDYDVDFAPPALLGIGGSTWIALGLASVLVWGWVLVLAWRMMG